MHHDSDELVLALRGLSLSYRARPALRGVDWTWRRGEHWAVLGPNGAGKSTLAAVLSGEQTHFSGHLERGPLLAERGVAYVCFERGRRLCERDRKLDCSEFEGSATDIGTSVRDLLAMPDGEARRFDELVELLDLRHVLDRGLRHVSTGELRKALLASALLQRPGLLILDSPLDGLDRTTQKRLNAALDTIIEDSPAVLVLSRSENEVPQACRRLMLLEDGRVRTTGSTPTLLNDPRTGALLTAPTLHFRPPAAVDAPTGASTAGGAASRASTDTGDTRDDRPPPTLDLRDVSVSFGELCVFRDLSWRLEADQHCLIAGPNGCGKSTLLDLLTGDNHKAYGQAVELFGRRRGSGESVWDIKRQFGRVDARMQFAVPSGSRVLDVVLSGHFDSLGLRDRPSDRQAARGRAWLAALGLAELAREEFHTLSFGLQRLALLARAMVKDPRILLLDEATLSLDTGHRRLLLEAVDHVIATSPCQLLFVSHTPGEVPSCINQLLRFEPREGGSRVSVSAYPA
jgi:molybdate transport system ATP-binding protein